MLTTGRWGLPTKITHANKCDHATYGDQIRRGLVAGNPICFDVAGESFAPGYPENLYRLGELLDEIADGGGDEFLHASLIRNPQNLFDKNAVEVHVPAVGRIGYLPMEVNGGNPVTAVIADLIDAGTVLAAELVEVRVFDARPECPGATIRLRAVPLPFAATTH